ncbi:DEBR0S3_08614g1_1 [Brettanomyces bruxellensis]|uniref:DEBR0S3_08614g1_1 n=1 Tax=Dekkera bruxellensis TaxID=5007 RepID=A0A7D9CXV4_DEKBR|nr:DEBR0S3_08614g1_1 [Brettanomyces bruxellensis]
MVAFCCLWIASKYNENKPKGKLADALIRRAGYRTAQKKLFLALEARILNCIGWNLSYPATESFVDLFLNKAEPNNIERRYGALFLCELAHFNTAIFHHYSASAIAASAILLTNVALLNLRHKHVYQHRFGALDTLLLRSVRFMPSAVRYKYVDRDAHAQGAHAAQNVQSALGAHYSSKAAIIHNLVELADSFATEQRERRRSACGNKPLRACASPAQDSRRYLSLPISPIASPTRAKSAPISPASPRRTSAQGAPARSACLRHCTIPTPGSTPTALSTQGKTTAAPRRWHLRQRMRSRSRSCNFSHKWLRLRSRRRCQRITSARHPCGPSREMPPAHPSAEDCDLDSLCFQSFRPPLLEFIRAFHLSPCFICLFHYLHYIH